VNEAPNVPSPPPSIPPMPHTGQLSPLFLRIPVARLILLSIVSFSLYEAYWLYKNWQYVKQRDNLNIRPFWRGLFGAFFCHKLLRRIHEDQEARTFQVPSFSPGTLATWWVVLVILSSILARIPGLTASFVAAFVPSFLCFVPVQVYVNAVSERRNPGEPNHPWSSGHIVCLVLGVVCWGVMLLELAAGGK